MRPYLMTDLEWLEPLAKRYGEWRELLQALPNGLLALVDAPYAFVLLYEDAHGIAFGGLTDEKGMRHFYKLAKTVRDLAAKYEIPLHCHCKKGSWQERLSRGHGIEVRLEEPLEERKVGT